MSKTIRISVLLILTCILYGCQRRQDSDLQQLDQQAAQIMKGLKTGDLDSIASVLLKKAMADGNREYECKAHFYLSSFSETTSDSLVHCKMRHLETAKTIAEEIRNDSLLCWIYNQQGIWEMKNLRNIATSQYWFEKSIEQARKLNNIEMGISAETNLSEAYRLLDDTLGIRYDLQLLEYAKRSNNPVRMFASGLHCALYYAGIVEDTAQLRPYIDAMRPLIDKYPGTIDMVYSRFFLSKGDFSTAEKHIKRANPENYYDFQILYSEILNKLGRYGESQQWIDRAWPHREQIRTSDHARMLKLSADNKSRLGLQAEALALMRQYATFMDSVYQARNTDMTRRYRVEYEVNARDREIIEQKTRIRNLGYVIAAICAILLVTLVYWLLWQRRKNRYYLEIVNQNRKFIGLQEIQKERIVRKDAEIAFLQSKVKSIPSDEEEETQNRDPEHKKPNVVHCKRADEVFERIQQLVDDCQVWRDTAVTRDTFAEMAGCNRTYLTEIIKHKTGLSYTQFMNDCRVREAVKILSDPSDITPLKDLSKQLGFITISNFYTCFRNSMGISPAAFRKSASKT